MRFVETQRTPGSPVTADDQRRITAESVRTGVPPIQLGWVGLARLAGHNVELPDKENP